MSVETSKDKYERNHNVGKNWCQRWKKADAFFIKWARKHKCQQLAEYYEGEQYERELEGMDPLVFNLFYSSVESRLPVMSFQNPVATIRPRPGKMDYEADLAVKEANLRTDMVNTYLCDESNGFGDICEQAIIDAQFYFGIVEVGYSASWIENPAASKPVIKTDTDEDNDDDEIVDTSVDVKELPEEERIYVKHIPPQNFRIGGNDKWITEQSSWCGYTEYFRIEDLLSIDEVRKILEYENLEAGCRSDDFIPETLAEGTKEATDLIECLTIFDHRKKVRLFISKTHGCLLQEVSFKRLPIFPLRFSKPAASHGWYPIPPAKAWKSPQDEFNSAKRAKQAYQLRALPKWIANEAAFTDEEELNKLTSQVPFTISMLSSNDVSTAIAPLPFPNLNSEFGNSLNSSREDFNFAAGTSLDVAQSADRETATKSKIVATRAGIRESRTLGITAKWMASVVEEISMLQAERLTQEVWVRHALDAEPTLQEIQDIQQVWKLIDPVTNLSTDFSYRVDIDVSSLSPVSREEEKNALLELMAIINQYPQFAFSPKLIRYIASKLNVRAEAALQELQQLALVTQLGMAQQMGAATEGNALAQRTTAMATPTENEQITNQLKNQVGLPSA